MDLQQLSKKGTVSLLTLPKSDFFDAATVKFGTNDATTTATSSAAGNKSINNQTNDSRIASSSSSHDGGQLLLLQLPSGWSPSDLKNCHFVGPTQNCRDNNNNNNNHSSKDSSNHTSAATINQQKRLKSTSAGTDSCSSTNHQQQQQQQQQAALISENKRMSFSVHRVETSNALILIPPNDTTVSSDNKEDHYCNEKKKQKINSGEAKAAGTATTIHLVPLAARLLKKGGSGASFLELRRKQLSMPPLLNVLLSPKLPTSSSPGPGYTVDQMAHQLQASTAEIRKALRHLGAFRIPDTIPNAYTILPHETKLQSMYGILSTLLEVDEHSDYAGSTGISVEALVRHAQERILPTEQLYEDDDDTENRNVSFPAHSSAVIRHCLESLSASSASSPTTATTGDRMRLDVQKVRKHAWCKKKPGDTFYANLTFRIGLVLFSNCDRWLLGWHAVSFKCSYNHGRRLCFFQDGRPNFPGSETCIK